MVGGLIVHNSWRSGGHSVEYWMNEISEENENVICPNHEVSLNWIPAFYDNLSLSPLDPSKWSHDIQRIRGKGISSFPDLLQPTEHSSFDPNDTFVLERFGGDSWVEHLSNGLDRTHLIQIHPNGNYLRIVINDYPFWRLGFLLTPIKIIPNDEFSCGTWIIPYEALTSMLRLNWDLLDNFRVWDFEVKFTDQSYLTQVPKSKDHSYLESSTKVIETVSFDGPLPYKYIY